MKLLMLMPLLVLACITTQFKKCTVMHARPQQKIVVVETQELNLLNPFFLLQ